ncbi:hypothetical protein NQ318_009497 [Aromia moschata]|uniref:Uncharacterized protein n=1 Tax=Aromia moschata TaxID=1265417 RepID=A0AAV8Z9R6_9CUCU|nr:hypothetical protein NQ318_009497 [Aromia moschata]
MANIRLLLLVILSLVGASLQDVDDNEIEDEEINPFAEAASSILKEQNVQNIGAMVNNFMQGDGAAKLGDMLSKYGGRERRATLAGALVSHDSAGDLLDGMGTLLGALQGSKGAGGAGGGDTADALLKGLGSLIGGLGDKGDKKSEGGKGINPALLLQGLGSLMGGLGEQGDKKSEGGNSIIPSLLLQGLSSLIGGLGDQGDKKSEDGKGINPALIGSVLKLLAQNQAKPEPGKDQKRLRVKVGSRDSGESYDVSDLLSLAASYLVQDQGEGQGQAGSLLNYLPMILKTVKAFTGPEAEKRAEEHAEHSSMLPPFLEKIHIAFDSFIHSEMGKYLINVVGAEKAFKVFEDENGRFNYSKFSESMENLSFRRHWIRSVTDRLVGLLQYASDPKMQKMYLFNVQFLVNSFLKAQGFPKGKLFDPTHPTESLSAVVDYAMNKYFDVPVTSKEYLKPVVDYAQDINSMAQKGASFAEEGVSKELSNKLADTINLEIIEPIARVNRAYRFAKSTPECERYVLCIVNEKNPNEVDSLPRLKRLLYKGSSLVAAWFLSDETGMSFWPLYRDMVDNKDCKALYNDKCHDFHVEEIKVTTEYVHNEL